MSNTWVAFYEPEGADVGRIRSVFCGNAASIAAAATHKALPYLAVPAVLTAIAHQLPGSHHVAAGALEARAEVAAVWDAANQVLAPLPVPCTVRVDGEAYAVDDGSAEFGSLPSGTYDMIVVAPGHVTKTYVVTV